MKNILLFLFSLSLGLGLMFVFLMFFTSLKNQNPQLKKKIYENFSIENAPTNSFQGTIATISGTVDWQSRIATQPATITQPQLVQQGENIFTKDDGMTILQFPGNNSLKMHPNSELDIIQTLPQSFVFVQNYGTIDYITSGTIPVSVRSLHLLVALSPGESSVQVDQILPVVTVAINSGSAQIGFNDLQYMSNVLSIPQGNKLIYNDATRKTSVEPIIQ